MEWGEKLFSIRLISVGFEMTDKAQLYVSLVLDSRVTHLCEKFES